MRIIRIVGRVLGALIIIVWWTVIGLALSTARMNGGKV